ncbi:hypothetical protein Tco_1390207 [Tanacetum coccineum]
MVVPTLFDTSDRLIWKNYDNVESNFAVATLVIKRKLKAHDTLRQWDVWEHLKTFTGMPNVPSDLSSIVDFLISIAKMRSARSVIAKLIFSDASYFIWQERNYRIFKKSKRSPNQIIDIIKSTVLLKLLTYKFKRTKNDDLVVECSPRAVLFFPSPRFFSPGFTWEGFLRKQYRLAYFSHMVLLLRGAVGLFVPLDGFFLLV